MKHRGFFRRPKDGISHVMGVQSDFTGHSKEHLTTPTAILYGQGPNFIGAVSILSLQPSASRAGCIAGSSANLRSSHNHRSSFGSESNISLNNGF